MSINVELVISFQPCNSPPMQRVFSQISQSTSDEDRSGASSCAGSRRGSNPLLTSGNVRDEAGKAKYLEQQVMTLTRDKKQLMTHLHWLSRQRADQIRNDSLPAKLDSRGKRVSLEEGNATSFDSSVAGIANLTRGKRFDCVSRSESVDNAVEQMQLGTAGKVEDSRTDVNHERELVERLQRLKSLMLQVKQVVVKSNEACDSIFQLSFQNLKHPNEPRSYSIWSSCDDENLSSWSSLVKSQEHMNAPVNAITGYRSLENYSFIPKLDNDVSSICHCYLKKRNSSLSSPELFLGRQLGFGESLAQYPSPDITKREPSTLSRSLSDQETKKLLSSNFLGHCMQAKVRAKPVFSTLTSADDSENSPGSTHISDEICKSSNFSSLGQVIRQPEVNEDLTMNQNEDDSLAVLTPSSYPSGKFYSENLIS